LISIPSIISAKISLLKSVVNLNKYTLHKTSGKQQFHNCLWMIVKQ
jgi:hypothetical protein